MEKQSGFGGLGCMLFVVLLLIGAAAYVYTQGNIVLVEKSHSINDDLRHSQKVDALMTNMRSSGRRY